VSAKKKTARKVATRSSGAAKPKKATAAKKRTATKKTATKKTAVKKTVVKRAVGKRPTAKKTVAKKATVKKNAAKKTTAKKTTGKRAAVSTKSSARATLKKAIARTAAKKKAGAKKSATTTTKTKRSEQLPETKSRAAAKGVAKSASTGVAGKAQGRAPKSARVAARSERPRPKKRRENKPKPPAKTMSAPEPIREVLVFAEMPDVSRAISAKTRRAGARGHLQPNLTDTHSDESGDDIPLDATLIMNTLAVDVQPKIEDNYDYSVLDEFNASAACPRPTRMLNTGCGGGEAAVYFAKLGFSCVGIDPDRADVGLARERAWLAAVDIDFMVGDLFETPNLLPAESFGLAVDRGAFYQIEDERERQRYLSNIKRLLFKGGVMLLSAGFFPLEDEKARKSRAKKGNSILLAREGGVVVQEMRAAGFALLHRVLRPTNDSGELGELLLYLRK